MIRCIFQELKKNLYFPYAFLAILGIVLLALVSPGGTSETGADITIFSMLHNTVENGRMADIGQAGLVLWGKGLSGWMAIFVPFLLTFGYIAVTVNEHQDMFTRFQLLRFGKLNYCISKVCGGALSGGILFTLGYGLFGLIMLAVFPDFSSFPQEEQEIYLMMWGTNAADYIVKQLLGAFLYGMGASTFGIGVTIFFRDKYMLLCLPLLLNYAYGQVLNKQMDDRMKAGKGYEMLLAFMPESLIRNMLWDKYWFAGVVFMLAVYAVLLFIFYRMVKRGYFSG